MATSFKQGYFKIVDDEGNEVVLLPKTLATLISCNNGEDLQAILSDIERRLDAQDIILLVPDKDDLIISAEHRPSSIDDIV